MATTSDIADEIPPEFYERLRKRVLSKVGSKSAFGMDCWEWLGEKKIGKTKDNYGMLTLYVGGDRLRGHSHRAAYIAFNDQFILPHNISHLCHNHMNGMEKL